MPTASSPVPRSASTQPMPPQYGPRGAVSRASMIRRALDLGAPVTEPGGKVAASSSGQPAPSAQLAAHGGDEVDQARVLLDGAQLGDGHGARGADPAEVVADQVDDHHVLGVVLLQQVRRGAAGALDRAGLDGAARRGAGRARARRWRSPRRARAGGSFPRTAPGCRAPAARSARPRRRPGRAAARTGPGRGSPGRPRRPRCARGCAARPPCTRRGRGRTSSRRRPGPRQRPGTGAGTGSRRTSPKRAQTRPPLEVRRRRPRSRRSPGPRDRW